MYRRQYKVWLQKLKVDSRQSQSASVSLQIDSVCENEYRNADTEAAEAQRISRIEPSLSWQPTLCRLQQ